MVNCLQSHLSTCQVDNLLHLSHMILLGEAGCPPGVGAMKTPSIKISLILGVFIAFFHQYRLCVAWLNRTLSLFIINEYHVMCVGSLQQGSEAGSPQIALNLSQIGTKKVPGARYFDQMENPENSGKLCRVNSCRYLWKRGYSTFLVLLPKKQF